MATKSEFVTSVKLAYHLSVFKTLLIQLKPSNHEPQVNEKTFSVAWNYLIFSTRFSFIEQ